MNYYEILKIKNNATKEQIRIAYRKIAKENHPDLNKKADPKKMVEINQAYNTLNDPSKKSMYDLTIGINNPFSQKSGGSTYTYTDPVEDVMKAWRENMHKNWDFDFNWGHVDMDGTSPPFHPNARNTFYEDWNATINKKKRKSLTVKFIKRILYKEIYQKREHTAISTISCYFCASIIHYGKIYIRMTGSNKICVDCRDDILSHL